MKRYFLVAVLLLTGCGVSEASPSSMEPIPQITTSYTYVIPPGPLVTASEGAVRGSTTLVGPEPTAPPETAPKRLVGEPYDCASWQEAFTNNGATDEEVIFFFGLNGGTNIIHRETYCGGGLLNHSSGDSGICQIAPIHNNAGYFGGVEYGPGGWLMALHGLRTKENLESPEWVKACLTLYRVCGRLAWSPPSYGCLNRRYP